MGAGGRTAGWSHLLALAALCILLAPSAAQMESPLKGQGLPQKETTDVYVSVYLDRLLGVDAKKYRWEGALMYFITWKDSTAAAKVAEATARMRNGSSCAKQCTNNVDGVACCDGIYIPAFNFVNAYGFSQDRLVSYRILLSPDNSSVMLHTYVQGSFYQCLQPMSFQHFPFDSFVLDTTVQFIDTSGLVDGHEGITIHESSKDKTYLSYGKGDDTAEWEVQSVELQQWSAPNYLLFADGTTSDPGDPWPLLPADPAVQPAFSETGQFMFVGITVKRFWRYHLVNSVLPIVLVAILGLFILVLDMSDLGNRLAIIVTLFLALTAVQFVLLDTAPSSSYVLPTQQLVLATYVFLALLGVESIVVYHLANWVTLSERRKEWREARRRYHAAANHDKAKQKAASTEDEGELPVSEPGSKAAQLKNAKPSRSRQFLETSVGYGEWMANAVDVVCGVVGAFAYALAAILIFTLQSGYIDLYNVKAEEVHQ